MYTFKCDRALKINKFMNKFLLKTTISAYNMQRLVIPGLLIAFSVNFLLIMLNVGTVSAASQCFQESLPKNGKSYYSSVSCPPGLGVEPNKCYVYDNGKTTPRIFDNGLACAADMINKMKASRSLPTGCPYGDPGPPAPGTVCPYERDGFGTVNPSLGVSTATTIIGADQDAIDCATSDCNFIQKYINPLIRFLSAGVGVVITLMIIIAGIQYSSAGSDPQKVAASKRKITNAIVALILYLLLFAILNWLVPGGLV